MYFMMSYELIPGQCVKFPSKRAATERKNNARPAPSLERHVIARGISSSSGAWTANRPQNLVHLRLHV